MHVIIYTEYVSSRGVLRPKCFISIQFSFIPNVFPREEFFALNFLLVYNFPKYRMFFLADQLFA